MAFWLGVVCALAGVALYVVQLLVVGRADTPWYAPALATVGAVLVAASVRSGPSAGRSLVLLLMLAVAGFEWWFLLGYARLPAYEGPVRAGQEFPEFHTARADGSPFTRADLVGDRATALVFFRGRW